MVKPRPADWGKPEMQSVTNFGIPNMICVEELAKVYPGPVAALRGVSIEIGTGMFGLLGPNGAGKSTFMNILAGLLEPTAGRATLDGIDILNDPRQLWERLGYLPQEFGFYDNLTGQAMLKYLLKLKGVSAPQGLNQLTNELLEKVNLAFAAKRKVKAYSGGMKQRLGIAQAIAGNPRLIIVDEPTAGLDPEERLRFYRLLSELAAERIVILSTHIVEDVANLCSRFAVIRDGRIIADTSPSAAKAEIEGTLFEGDVDNQLMIAFQSRHRVARAILVEGRNRVRIQVTNGTEIPDGFVPVNASLEDAYLLKMHAAKPLQTAVA
jgi:ABC-2 type transport system ATP-binding protein